MPFCMAFRPFAGKHLPCTADGTILSYPEPSPPVMRCPLLLALLLLPAVALAQSPDEAGLLAEATVAYERGDLGEAVALAEETVGRDRRNAEAHHLLALVYGQDGPLHDERLARGHAERAVAADPDNPRYLKTQLRQLQRTLSEERAFSVTDGRRAALARRILALDPESAVAHEERALGYVLEFDWRRGLAERQGGWDRAAERGLSGAANRALRRAREHLDRALLAEPARASAHRLALRTAALARDNAALLDAARRMKAARPADPDADLFLGLGLTRAGRDAEADRAFADALAAMPERERRAVESVARFVGAADEAAFATDSAAFAAGFWQRRDPRLLTPHNERRLEHLARLALADLLFSEPRTGRRGWDSAKGEVAVRYGLPRWEASWLANDIVGKDFSRYNRWVYGDPGSGPGQAFTLLFEDAFRDGDYDFWSSAAGEDEVTRARSLFARLPERFDYAPPGRVTLPFATATFRGASGRSDVVVAYAMPTGTDSGQRRSGAFLLGASGEVVAEERRAAGAEVEALTLHAAPGAYILAVEFEASGALGFERAELAVPSYAAGFGLSDVLPAVLVEEEEGSSGLRRRGFRIVPAPGVPFAVGQPVYLYFEGYDLAPASDGGSRYAVEVALRPKDPATGLAKLARRLFGDAARGVAVEFEGSSPERSFGEVVVLDTGRQRPGPHVLTLRLRDLGSGRTLARTADLFLE